MTAPYLEIISSQGTIGLNGIATLGEGVEAQPGATGLGLPPISASFSTGVGDGSVLVGTRVESRVLAVPVAIAAESREGLKEQMRTLARIVSAKDVRLRWVDPDAEEAFTLDVVLTAGGDYTYGVDTTGEFMASTTFSFTSEGPFWTNEIESNISPVQFDYGTDASATQSVTLSNAGSAPTYPMVRLSGPLRSARISAPDGSTVAYNERIDAGNTVTIDMHSGTVTDGSGDSVYQNLGPAPAFFGIEPGDNPLTVTVVAIPQADTPNPAAALRTNYVTNPRLSGGSGKFTFAGWALPTDSTTNSNLVAGVSPSASAGEIGYLCDWWNSQTIRTFTADTPAASASMTLTGLTAGEHMVFTMRVWAHFPGSVYAGGVRIIDGSTVIGQGPIPTRMSGDWFHGQAMHLDDPADVGRYQVVSYPFIVPASGTVKVVINPPVSYAGGYYSASTFTYSHFYLGKAGDYFDGDTADSSSLNFGWAGTANASASLMTLNDPAKVYLPVFEASWNTREWLVI